MTRFAIAVTVIEIILTLGASLMIAYVEPGEPTLSKGELEDMGFRVDSHRTRSKRYFQTLTRHDTHATLGEPRRRVFTSVRVNESPADYVLRHRREVDLISDKSQGDGVLIEEPYDDEVGYALRHVMEDLVRAEVVRARANDMVIVQVTQEAVEGPAAQRAVAGCERQARIIMQVCVPGQSVHLFSPLKIFIPVGAWIWCAMKVHE